MLSDGLNIVVYGDGFAGALTALSLANGLPNTHVIHYVRSGDLSQVDALYGSVTAPTAYDFLRTAGLDEPTLFMRSRTAFCFGTRYQDWPGGLSWMQGYAQPFQNIAGVPLVHHLTRGDAALEPILVSAQAALNGRFAHPPEDANVPLSRAEYGYQFSVADWTELLQSALAQSRVVQHQAGFDRFISRDDGSTAIKLASGEVLEGNLFVDCSGNRRALMSGEDASYSRLRSLYMARDVTASSELGWPYRSVRAERDGWTSQTHLQGAVETLRVSAEELENSAKVDIGYLDKAWSGNCVAIGHAACVLEPLTPAPMILLQRDIERLLELIPVSGDFQTERREFNRRYRDDVEHASMFQEAFYALDHLPETPFWQAAAHLEQSPKLARKLAQFENRGVLVRYDLEPFNDEDWTILHFGVGRRPRQYDLQVEQMSAEDSLSQIAHLKQSIAQMVPRMPPHHLYVANMKKYFEKQNYG